MVGEVRASGPCPQVQKYRPSGRGSGWRGRLPTGILTAAIIALLVCAPALAITPAGTVISNVAICIYDGGSVSSNSVDVVILQVGGCQVTPGSGAQSGVAGGVVFLPVVVANTGNGSDTFSLATSSTAGWSVLIYQDDNGDGLHQVGETTVLTSTGPLAMGGQAACILAVSLPAGVAGSDSVTLTARSGYDTQSLATATFVVNSAVPVSANFSASPTSGPAPLAVTFTDKSSGSPTAWSWSFGDGSTSSQQNPSHAYSAAGTYTVALTASNAGGQNTKTIGGCISVSAAPPAANFSASLTSGPAPLTVAFTDTSSGSPTAWSWSFGDGGTSSQQNPNHTYSAAGTYTVALTASNAGGPNTKAIAGCVSVTVAPPAANFSASPPTSGPAPLTVAFADTSSGNPTAWSWSFGDGGTSSQQNPSHTYSAAGTYTVALTASNAGGQNTKAIAGCVSVTVAPPAANFSASPPTSGPAPLTVAFADTSSGNPTAWSWSFGDGGTSSQQNPSHTYSAAGTYTVALTASNAGGQNTRTTPSCVSVTVAAPTANFSASPTSGPAPLTVAFTDTSSGSPTAWSWSFGDRATSTVQNPSHTYSAAGTYTVALTASNAGGPNTKTIAGCVSVTAAPPAASFSASPTSGTAPLAVAFTDTSSGSPTAWSWSFGDGNASSQQNPRHTYSAAGTYTVALTASNAGGPNTKTIAGCVSVSVAPPAASFSASPTNGTAPLTVTFTDTSSGSPTAWSWSFGDGATSTVQSPSHTYSAAGTYTVALTASNAGGPNIKTIAGCVSVTAAPPAANFSASPTNGPAPLSVQFTDLSSGTPTSWLWFFGDGFTSTQQNPSHMYSAAGSYTVTLTASNAGGQNTKTAPSCVSVTAAPPVANFSASTTNGTAPLAVFFADTSSGSPTAWAWSFGDGNTSSQQNPRHTYSTAGTYTVALTASNASGENTKTSASCVSVTVVAPAANFSASTTNGTAPLAVFFADTSSGSPTAWAWSFGDGNTSSQQNPRHTYGTSGTYTVALTASNASGQNTKTSASYVSVTVGAPGANFSASPESGPAPFSVQFADLSVGTPTSWLWDFGDGSTSTQQSPSHVYTSSGSYTVSLAVSNVGGQNTLTKNGCISVSTGNLAANFSASPASGPAPLTVAFTNQSSGKVIGSAWTFGDGSESFSAERYT